MWTVKRIEAENFMAFRRLALDIGRYHGVTLIEGRRDGPGRSNGAAKSTLFEVIYWGLTGKLARRNKNASKVMHRWTRHGESTVVRLVLDVDGREVVVERARSRSGPTLRLHDSAAKATGIVEGVQERVYALLGTDERMLGITTVFSGSMANFCQLTDAERKELLERMLGAEHYTAAGDEAKRRLAAAESRLAVARAELAGLDARLEQVAEERTREVRRLIKATRAAVARERDMVKRAQQAAETNDAAHRELSAFYVEAAAVRRSQSALRADLDSRMSSVDQQMETHRAVIAKADQAAAVRRAKMSELSQEVDRLRRDEHPDICPHCNQRWPAIGGKDHLEKLVAAKRAELEQVRLSLGPVTAERLHASDDLAARAEDQRELAQAIRDLEAAADPRRERRVLAAALEAAGALKAALNELWRHRQDMPEEDEGRLELDTTAIDKRAAEMRAARTDLAHETQDLGTTSARLEFWRRGFSRQGLPSYLIDSSIPQMNETVGRVASALSDGELSVAFDPAAAKGSGDVFAVKVDYRDGGDDYDLSSNGEHTRVDLAVLFAIRDLIASRGANQCTQLFLDEVMQGVDAAFAENFIGMLRNNYRDRDVFIISHDDAIKAQCDGCITVQKVGREASIV